MKYLKFFNNYQNKKNKELELGFKLVISFISKVFIILKHQKNKNSFFIEILKFLKKEEYVLNNDKINYEKFEKQKIQKKEEILDLIYSIITIKELEESDKIRKKIKNKINDEVFINLYK
jgi:hypothetical protein